MGIVSREERVKVYLINKEIACEYAMENELRMHLTHTVSDCDILC